MSNDRNRRLMGQLFSTTTTKIILYPISDFIASQRGKFLGEENKNQETSRAQSAAKCALPR